jgi:hypothetical protein
MHDANGEVIATRNVETDRRAVYPCTKDEELDLGQAYASARSSASARCGDWFRLAQFDHSALGRTPLPPSRVRPGDRRGRSRSLLRPRTRVTGRQRPRLLRAVRAFATTPPEAERSRLERRARLRRRLLLSRAVSSVPVLLRVSVRRLLRSSPRCERSFRSVARGEAETRGRQAQVRSSREKTPGARTHCCSGLVAEQHRRSCRIRRRHPLHDETVGINPLEIAFIGERHGHPLLRADE